MKKVWILILMLVMVSSLPVLAQDADLARMKNAAMVNTFGARPAVSPFGLIDMSKLTFSHSYSVSFLSGGSGAGSVGMFNTTMMYEFSPKLSLALDLGVMHTGGALSSPGQRDADLLPGFRLDYHPSDKFSLTIGMSRVNPYYFPNQFGASRFSRQSWLGVGH